MLNKLASVPTFTLHAHVTLFRVQRVPQHHRGLTVGCLHLNHPGGLVWRYDLPDEATAYFAQSPTTACYEALCRRDKPWVSLDEIKRRELLVMTTTAATQLLDLRSAAMEWPVLQSQVFSFTQGVALEAREAGYKGLIYPSAQQLGGDCIALFPGAFSDQRLLAREPLLDPGGQTLHIAFEQALERSGLFLAP